jgi:hypothetical protein
MGTIGVLIHNSWLAVGSADVMTIVAGGLTVIDPLKVAVKQLFPIVTKVKLNGDPVVEAGVPEIVIVDPTSEAVTPVGKPVTVVAVAPPPMV